MFCPACDEEFPTPQPDGICLTCGEKLVVSSLPSAAAAGAAAATDRNAPTPRRTAAPRDDDDDVAAATAMNLLASSMENGTPIDNPSALMPLMNRLRGVERPGEGGEEGVGDLAGVLPPEAFDPQAGTRASRPASKTALDNLQRILLTPQSAELFDAQVNLFESRPMNDSSPCVADGNNNGDCLTLNAVPGEFGPMMSMVSSECVSVEKDMKMKCRRVSSPHTRTGALVVCSPRTVRGGSLSPETLSEIETLRKHRMPFVAYVERGDVTFVQKALACQRAGESKTSNDNLCIGVVVGNASSDVWPFVMQDNKKEAERFGLKVPVVMIRREDGARLLRWTKKKDHDGGDGVQRYTPCQVNVRSKHAESHTCPVCTDSYVPGATIVRLKCGHVFHESCALAWLTKHNTCPFCRTELPTDDDDYERERRRREANSNSSGDAGSGDNGRNFYG